MLTKRQHECLQTIRRLIDEKGYSPSYEEIARAMGLASISTAHKLVAALQQEGRVTMGRHRGRSIELVPELSGKNGAPVRACSSGHRRIWFDDGDCPICGFLKWLDVDQDTLRLAKQEAGL